MMFSNRSLDEIIQGTSNKYIKNNIYNDDLTVQGTLTVDNIIVNNNISIINNSIYNSECLNITNYTDNPSINVLQIGNGDILQIHNDYQPIFVMNNDGYIGNVTNPKYNVDIHGVINADYFRGSGKMLSNVNLYDKKTSELKEGSNLYFTDQRVYDILYSSNYIQNNPFIPLIDEVMDTICCMNLDRVVQGSSNKYVVNNIYNDDLLINGTLTVKHINIIDFDQDFYTMMYNCNLYMPDCLSSNYRFCSTANVSNIVRGMLADYSLGNISNTVIGIIENYSNYGLTGMLSIPNTSYLAEGSNLYFTEERTSNVLKPFITDISSTISNLITDINVITSNIQGIEDALCCINLDNVIQGSNNKYIVNNIYNDSLLINGILTVRNIHIMDVDQQYYTDVYNTHLYQPTCDGGITGGSGAVNVSNIVLGFNYDKKINDAYETLSYALTSESVLLSNRISTIGQRLNTQANDINLLKNNIITLTSNLEYAMQRIAILESKVV